MFVSVIMKGSCNAEHPYVQKGAGNGHAMKHDWDANSCTFVEIMIAAQQHMSFSVVPVTVFSFCLQNIF